MVLSGYLVITHPFLVLGTLLSASLSPQHNPLKELEAKARRVCSQVASGFEAKKLKGLVTLLRIWGWGGQVSMVRTRENVSSNHCHSGIKETSRPACVFIHTFIPQIFIYQAPIMFQVLG